MTVRLSFAGVFTLGVAGAIVFWIQPQHWWGWILAVTLFGPLCFWAIYLSLKLRSWNRFGKSNWMDQEL